MKKNLLLFVAFLFLIFFNVVIALKINKHNQRITATNRLLFEIEHARDNGHFSGGSVPLVLGAYTPQVEAGDSSDVRAANLRAIFRGRNSPLYDLADYIVEVSDKYQMDYRLIPAISIQESGGCINIPDDSYNCWGWGIYGSTITRFSSYEDAINTVADGLKTHYIDKGLVTPEQIMSKYNPSSNGSWAEGVNKIWGWFE